VTKAWHSVTIGVREMSAVLPLWRDIFGLEFVAQRSGSDHHLVNLWGLDKDAVVYQALLRSPGCHTGQVHLVEFNDPLPEVREDARVFDLCPKNLAVYVRDMPARIAELKASGRVFSSEDFSEVTVPNGVRLREIQLPEHDAINVVLLEILGQSFPFTSRGYAGVGPVTTVVADADREKRFYQSVLGLDCISDHLLEGLEIDQVVRLPPGAGVKVCILGAADQPFGQIEIVEYQELKGTGLYPRARPPGLGTLMVSYQVDDIKALADRLIRHRVKYTCSNAVDTVLGDGAVLQFASPAGFRVQVFETPVAAISG